VAVAALKLQVSKWLQALQMTKEFLAKMCGIPDSSLLLAQADIAKTLASQHLVQPALLLSSKSTID